MVGKGDLPVRKGPTGSRTTLFLAFPARHGTLYECGYAIRAIALATDAELLRGVPPEAQVSLDVARAAIRTNGNS